jgi:hypothetical protein
MFSGDADRSGAPRRDPTRSPARSAAERPFLRDSFWRASRSTADLVLFLLLTRASNSLSKESGIFKDMVLINALLE